MEKKEISLKQITSLDKFNDVISKYEKVVVDVSAKWCKPCKLYGPIVEKVALKNPKIRFVKIDIDSESISKGFISKYGEDVVSSLPSTVLFENGKMKKYKHGLMDEERLVKFISAI